MGLRLLYIFYRRQILALKGLKNIQCTVSLIWLEYWYQIVLKR